MTTNMNFLNYLGVAVVLVDGRDGQIVFANTQTTELTSYDLEELKKKKITEFFNSTDAAKLLDLLRLEPTRPEQLLTDVDFTLRRKSRRKLSISLTMCKTPEDHTVFVTLQDNTVIREAEWQLANAQSSLVEAAKFKALGEMAGGIAHEINNPLAIIAGLSDTLNYVSKDEEVHELSGKINLTVQRISKIITGLKMISRDHSKDPFVDCPLSSVLRDTLEFCKERFRNHQIELKVEEIPDAWTVRGRPTQLSQVFLNLLNNAFDAVSALELRWIRVLSEETDTHYKVTIQDSGRGIPKKIRQQIMEPFFTTKEVGAGTGLGLSISKGILESHQGRLELLDATEHTEFAILLPKPSLPPKTDPADSTKPLQPPLRPNPSHLTHSVHALIVEDEIELATLISHQLQKRGLQTTIASSGEDAAQLVKEKDFDIILSDVHMPRGNGFWLLSEIQKSKAKKGRLPPFIFVTGSVSLSLEEAYHLGAGAVFFKPIRFSALIDTILLMTAPQESRWSKRQPRVDVNLQVKIKDSSMNTMEQVHENLVNLGRGGMFIAMQAPLPQIGDSLQFEFSGSSKDSPRIAGAGVVRWVRESKSGDHAHPPGIGMEFIYIEKESVAELMKLINMVRTESYIPNKL